MVSIVEEECNENSSFVNYWHKYVVLFGGVWKRFSIVLVLAFSYHSAISVIVDIYFYMYSLMLCLYVLKHCSCYHIAT